MGAFVLPVGGRALLVAVASVVLAGALQPAAVAAPDDKTTTGAVGGRQASAATRTLQGAQKAAEEGDTNVEVTSLRTEAGEVYATPDGNFEAVQHLRPVRTRVDGEWKSIDDTLSKQSDGSVAPRASAVGIEFSGGGTNPLVTLERTGKRLSFSWPTSLPAPTLDGDTATYANVLPDIDLKLRASTDGFSQLLVVNSAEAAKNPKLAELKMGVESPGLDLQRTASGGLEAVDEAAGGVVFQAAQPLMWDSGQAEGTKTQLVRGPRTTAATAAESASDGDEGPGDGANIAPIGVEVASSGAELRLTPDKELLTDPATTFPVYIDPQTHTPKAGEWTMVSRYWANTPQWRFNDASDAGVGYCGWDYCAPYDLKRLFYRFPTGSFGGKSILKATFIAHETHSASCDARSVQLWRTKGITSSTTWNDQLASGFWIDNIDSRSVAKGASGCPAGDVEFDATAGVKYAASHDSSYTTFGLRAATEDDKYGWKRFSDDAFLRVTFNQPPKQIAMKQLTSSRGGTCRKPEKKVSIRSLPKIEASNVKDPDNDQVSVQFQLWWDAGSGFKSQWTSEKMTPKKSSGAGADFSTQLTETLSNKKTIPQNKTLAWYARAVDYEQGKYYSYSPWSGAGSATGCYFVWDKSVPDGPKITSGDYPAADDSDPEDPVYDGVGRYGTFTIDAPNSDVTKYWFGVNEEPSDDNEVSTSGGAARTVSFRPTRAGTNFVFAQAFDAAGNGSEPMTYKFRVKTGQPTRAEWKLDEAAGTPQAAGTSGTRTLDLKGAPTLGATGVKDTAVSLDGVDDYLVSDIPTVDTSTGFSVSAWVKPSKIPDSAAVIAAQPGNNAPGFELYYSKTYDRWAFNQYASDTASATPVRVMQGAAGGVKAGEWVLLTGTYSSSTDLLSLYVDGSLAGSAAYSTPWDARRGLQIGAGSYGGAPGSFFPGTIDDVRIYDKPLAAGEVTNLFNKQPIGTGRPARAVFSLDEPAADSGGEATTTVSGHADVNPAVFKGGAKPGEAGRAGEALSLDGVDDYATTTPHVNNQRSFSVVAWAKLPRTKPTHAAVIATQTSTVKPGFELYYSPTYGWSFNQYSQDSVDGTPMRAAQGDPGLAPGGEWTQVAGTYDAVDNYLRLYVQGTYVSRVNFDSPFYGGGPVQIGAGNYSGAADSFFPGQISDVQLYDRALSAGEMADMFDSRPTVEGRWRLDSSSGSPAVSPDDLAREDHTTHSLTLGSGAKVDVTGGSNMVGDGGLLLNGTSTGYAQTGPSASPSPIDTSRSFTVSAWVTAPARPQKPVTVMSMAGANRNGFAVRYVPDESSPATAGRWQLVTVSADSSTAQVSTAEHTLFQNTDAWNHIAVVYDAYAGQMRLYVDGNVQVRPCLDDDDDGEPDVPTCTEQVSWNSSVVPFAAAKGLQLGRLKTGSSTWGEYWSGAIDDVWALQGAASDTQIAALADRSGAGLPTIPGP
ncbi:LamG-like jellyroll fold domain-containing protein [Streptomyces sp. NBC_00568]|uniref:LamG-like jellyroll fold domain-containing protein n=1 Tax=Streptomyces sp. NBC_00568 TaxID=2975779 RepID=UPI002259FB6E|nr:LamG-like jellyroll fold domain-containing protein [Streptomyces sp. NBC_00568]MCX4993731.1 LamG domain-containing protein [Streptomyces sp. NBC_00568]